MDAYGFNHLWSQGDLLIRAVALLLLAMSLSSWTVILAKTWQQRRMRGVAVIARNDFWRAHSVLDGLRLFDTGRTPNPFGALVAGGMQAIKQRQTAGSEEMQGKIDAEDWLSSNLRATLDEGLYELQRGMSLLASIGSTAPFVGLFGTVWGIYHALIAISVAGQASIDKVAGPVGESLVMTALGLGVAIPAVLGYNGLVRGNKAIQAALNRFTRDLLGYLLAECVIRQSTEDVALKGLK